MIKNIAKTAALAIPCVLNYSCASKVKPEEKKEKKPNIVMFFTDDNAFWYWGFGGGPDLSPTIDAIGAQGVECTQFYATAPVCTPSRYSLQTGKYAGRCESNQFNNDFPKNGAYNITWNTFLNDSPEITIGNMFQKGGYETAFIGKWHLGEEEIIDKYGFKPKDDPADPEIAQKLLDYQEDMVNLIKSKGYDYAASIVPSNNDTHPIEALQHHNLEWYAKGAIDFITKERDTNKPFFLLVNITTHHGPCHRESLQQDVKITQAGYIDGLEGIMPSRASVFERIKEKGYDIDFKTSGTVWTDDCVKAVLDKVNESKIEDNTAVIFTTDHNRFDGKATCYQGGVHIPFLMKYPGVIPAGSKSDARMQLIDLFPTFMDMAGIELPANIGIDGVNVWSALQGKDMGYVRDTMFFEFGYTRGILLGDYKYIAYRLPQDKIEEMKNGKRNKAYGITAKTGQYPNALRYPGYFEPDQLYNVKEDYEEQNNLAGDPEYAEIMANLKAVLATKLSTFEHPFNLDEVDEFYYTVEYKELCKAAREGTDLSIYYWYQRGCY